MKLISGSIDIMRERTITRNIPYTITYSVDGITKKKRFKTPTEAWKYMKEVGGSICFGFRIYNEVV
jgi:hypothetical protein